MNADDREDMPGARREWWIETVEQLEPQHLGAVLAASVDEGFRFVRRLLEEWESGENRFDGPGEALYALWDRQMGIVGICGVNADPYARDPAVGRLRHLYVLPTYRRRGHGSRLVRRALEPARERFERVRLRTDSDAAAVFYASLGFRPTGPGGQSTHEMRWGEPG